VAQLVAQLTPISVPEEPRFSPDLLCADMSPSRRSFAMSCLVLAGFRPRVTTTSEGRPSM